MKLTSTLQKIGYWIVFVTVVLSPLFFLPITSEFYEFNKQALFLIATAALLIIWTVSFVMDRQVRITRNPLNVPLLALSGVFLLSALTKSPDRYNALFEPGQAGTIIILSFFFITAVNFVRTRKELNFLTYGMIASYSVLAALAIVWGSGLLTNILPVGFLQSSFWTPTGNSLTTLILLVSLLPLLAIFAYNHRAESAKMLGISVAMLLCLIGSVVLGYQLFRPDSVGRPIFLSQSASWSIALESLKTSPLLGTGPATYLSDFTRFRPLSFNMTPNWAIRFTSASNYYLQLLTVVGLLGFAAYIALALRTLQLFFRSLRTSSESPVHLTVIAATLTLIVLFVAQLFVPVSISILGLMFTLMVITITSFKLMGSSLVHEANIDIVAASENGLRFPLLPAISLLLVILVLSPTLYYFAKGYMAEYIFQKALTYASANDGRKTYDTLILAIAANPYKDNYRVAYSQTNLLLANSLAAKKDLTDADRATITQLVQQSIREAKNAVALDPVQIINVENLANLYRNLLNFAQGADTWAVASYRQAAALDPVNPNLRIALGGIFFSAKQYDQAITYFRQAVDLKPDLANSYYNLAAAYREKGEYANALTAMQSVVTLVDRNSPDFQKAQSELDDLQKKVGQSAAAQPPAETANSQLQTPGPLPTPKINPPLKLPSDLSPEAPSTPSSSTEIKPTVTPKVTHTPTPTP